MKKKDINKNPSIDNIAVSASDTLLERKNTVVISGKTYKVDRLSNRMLIKVSGDIARYIPKIDLTADPLTEALRVARFTSVHKVVASLIVRPGIFSSIRMKIIERRLNNADIDELYNATYQLLNTRGLSNFFALIVFLSGVNHLDPMTGNAMEQEVYGQSSEGLQEHTE